MIKNIFVNATSATVGGSLTILNQFVEEIEEENDENKKYYIFIPKTLNLNSKNNIQYVVIEAKKHLDRIIWDLTGMYKWAKELRIKPDLIISLQNTGVKFDNVKQIIYLHQPIPYSRDIKWSIFKRDERKLWFYKYPYKYWINKTINKKDNIVVQTKWMKDELIREGYREENICISKPNIKDIDINKVDQIEKEDGKVYLFYPAADYKYKNHELIIEVIKKIVINNSELANKIKVIFTVDKKSNAYKKVIEAELEDYIKTIGVVSFDEILKYYKSSDIILFPSYIETFGLPLIEASKFKKKILVADCIYAKEVLQGYNNATFIDYKSVDDWYKQIEKCVNSISDIDDINCKEIVYQDGWNTMFSLINNILSVE